MVGGLGDLAEGSAKQLPCLAEVIEEPYRLDQEQWKAIGPSALPADAVEEASSTFMRL